MSSRKIVKGFRVKEIINETKLIINYGIEDGASVGQKVIIYDGISNNSDSNVADPLETQKETLEITQTYIKSSLCEKIHLGPSQMDIIASSFSPLVQLSSRSKNVVSFKADEEEMSHRDIEFDETIHNNDPVIILCN